MCKAEGERSRVWLRHVDRSVSEYFCAKNEIQETIT